MKIKCLLLPIILCLLFSNCAKPSQKYFDLLNEYKLLYIDLENFGKWGYKSYHTFDITSDIRATGLINILQGALTHTGINTDIAILGDGFLKLRLENDRIGYTRAGSFKIDAQGNLVSPHGYFLYDNINFAEYFLSDTINIARDGKITVMKTANHHTSFELKIADNNVTANNSADSNSLIVADAGRLVLYKIPAELLTHYKDAIYVIKDGAEYHEEIADNDSFLQSFLEMSNLNLADALLRMYYILSVMEPGLIANTEFKKEIIMRLFASYIETSKSGTYEGIINAVRLFTPYLRHDY